MSDNDQSWMSLAGRVRWDLMMAGITVLPDLPPGWPRASGSGALVEEADGHVAIRWNAPVALADGNEAAGIILAEDQLQQRREAISKTMLAAIAEVLADYAVDIDTTNWSYMKVTDGPGGGWNR